MLMVSAHAQTESPQKKTQHAWFFQPGCNLNYPLHDDMIRSHRLGAGLSLMGGRTFTPKYSGGIRLGYDYHWPRNHYPDDYNGSDTSRLPFSVLTFQWCNIFSFRKHWYAGLDMGYGLPDTKGSSGGLGWIQEYDGNTRNYLATSLSFGKNLAPSSKMPLLLSIMLENLFGEGHAENMLKLRLEIRL